MSLIRLKRSFSDFLRNDKKKTKNNKAFKSMDDIVSLTSMMSRDTDAMPNTFKVDETTYVKDLFQTYHDPSVLDVRRLVKYGLNVLSVTIPPTSVRPEPWNITKELSLVPRTPLLPSTPIFENSLSISFDGFPCPRTPSTICSTPPLSPMALGASVASVGNVHTVTVNDFHVLQFLSKGGWGQVYLAKHTVSSKRLALKVMKRAEKVFSFPVVKQLLVQEKNIMESLQGCDWFAQLEASWCDSNNLYLAMAYYPTDLESEIIRCERLSETRARFYMAEMIIALEELHKRGIVHRDIKTGNILIRADGHIVLADFGLSKDFGGRPTLAERCFQPYWPFRAGDDATTTSPRSPTELFFVTGEMLGSELEMAPEIIMEEYYSFGVDFWAAGVTLYVMVTGLHPWSEDNEKSLQLQILEDEIEFEEDDISEECQDFIRQMLKKEPSERLRIGQDMTSHPYFAGVDWVAMGNRTVPPPWVPDFVSGHHFYEAWDSLEMFEPGIPVDKDEDEFKDFFFTSPELDRCVETPLEEFFKHGLEDEPVEGEEPYNSDDEDNYMPDMVIFPHDRAKACFPTVVVSVSHASLEATFQSASSLQSLLNVGCTHGQLPEIVPPCAESTYFVNKPEPEKLAKHVSSIAEWRMAELTIPEHVYSKPVSPSFRYNTDPVSVPVMGHYSFGIQSNNNTRRGGLLNRIASWFKGLLCSGRNVEITDAWTVAKNLTIWERIKKRFRHLPAREAKYGQGYQLRGLDLC